MPIGIIVNVGAVLIGGLVGTALRKALPECLRAQLPLYCGLMSFVIGIATMKSLTTLTAVIGALLIGAVIGELLRLEDRLNHVGAAVQDWTVRRLPALTSAGADTDMLIAVTVLFVFNGSGFFGALQEGMTGDGAFLLTKSVLDFVTAVVFAAALGIVVSLLAAPQAIILFALFAVAGLLAPYCTPTMLNDFSACGGAIMFFTGFRICKMRDVPVTNLLPALVLVMPLSRLFGQ